MAGQKYPLSLVIRAVDKVTAPLQAVNKKLEKAFRPINVPLQRLSNRLGALSKAAGIPAIAERFKGVGEAAGKVGTEAGKLVGLFAGIALAGGAAFYGLVRSAEAAGSRLEDLSTLTGLSVNAFAELEFAAKRSGVENEAFAAGMGKFNKSLSEAKRGVGPLAGLLQKVGPKYLSQLKLVKSNEEGFTLLAKAMEKIQDPGKRAELAAAAFGKSGLGMVNALKDGPAGVAALREEYRRLVGDQTAFAAGAGALGDSFDNLELSVMGVRNTLAGALFPAVQKVTDAVTAFVVKNRDGLQAWATKTGAAIQAWVDGGGLDRLAKSVGKVADDVGKLVDKLGGLENAATLVAVAMGAPLISATLNLSVQLVGLGKEVALLAYKMGSLLVTALGKLALGILNFNFAPLLAGLTSASASVWAFTAALLANPITWVVLAVAALAGAVYLIYKNWDPIAAWFKRMWDKVWGVIGPTVMKIWNVLKWLTPYDVIVENWEPIKAFFSELWDGIASVFQSGWARVEPWVDKLMTVARFMPGIGLAVGGGLNAGSLFSGESTPAASLGAARALPSPMQPPQAGTAYVQVDFANLPRGARVTPARDNTAELDLGLGYSMVTP